MSALPKQVQDQIEEAERIASAIKAEQEGTEAEETSPEEGEAAAQDVTFEAEPNIVEEHGFQENEEEAEEAAEEIAATQEAAPQTQEGDEFEHKYKTLQGMYNAEKRANAELTGRVEGLENMLAQLQAAREAAPVEREEVSQEPTSFLSQEEIDDYGSDLIDVMKRAARDAVKDEMFELRNENERLKTMLGGVGQKMEQDDRSRMYADLDTLVTGWRDTNRDPAFLQWLEETDIYSGEPRNALLHRAFSENDATRVARFFQGYLEEVAAVNQAAPRSQPQATPSKTGESTGKVGLGSLVAPGAGHSGSADITKDQGRMWKESDIGNFYEAARRGQFKGREDEYRQTEREIQTAMTEGRVVVGQ